MKKLTKEEWPNLDHQERDKLAALCSKVGIPRNNWLSSRACEAIEKLLTIIEDAKNANITEYGEVADTGIARILDKVNE
jgi:hypothetical protein